MTEEQRNQYQAIIQARNFHYEQFTRRSGYFYLAIAVLFIGYYFIMQTPAVNAADSRLSGWVVLGIGYVTSVANCLSIKGYVYWGNQWNRLLKNFEEKVCKEEAVYNALAEKPKSKKSCGLLKGRNISPEKVLIVVAGMMVLGWSILIGFRASNWVINLLGIDCCYRPYVLWVTAIALWIICPLLSYCKSLRIDWLEPTDPCVEKSK